jgi:pimeloyl-ACP methyl ester carboxylesterase
MPFVIAAGRRLEYEFIGAHDAAAPALVFLHEGLGSIRQWRDFPAKVSAATGLAAMVYSRYGYGQSDVLQEPRRGERFMHDEALIALPEIFSSLGIERPILISHSDGASIALIHAGAGHAVRGIVAMAPHVFVEEINLAAIRALTKTFESTDLAQKLGRYHRDPRKTFHGWADAWLGFKTWDLREYCDGIEAPSLLIQGHDDVYGSMEQLDEIARRVKGPCEVLKLRGCGHSPFRDRPEETLSAVAAFVGKIKP